MKRSVILSCFVLLHFIAFSQYKPYYNVGIGARAGSTGATCGGTIKVFLTNKTATEAIIGYNRGALTGTLLVEKHFQVSRLKELQGYFGAGGHYVHASGYKNYILIDNRVRTYQDGGKGYGADLIAGLEYKFMDIPLAISVDLKPAIEFNSYGGFIVGIDKSIGIKLAL